MKNYNWEYFEAQTNKKVSEPKTIYSQRKIVVECFWIYEGYFGLYSNVRSRDK